jgi:acyl-CoA synthetase (NDP forming)
MTDDSFDRAALAPGRPALDAGTVHPRSTSLAAALEPASIAIIGASDNPNKVGGRPLLYLSRFGYRGRIYPVNPSRRTVQGLQAYPDVASLPEAPDLVVIAAPKPHVAQAVSACADRGVRAAIVMAAGFGETHDAESAAAERRMVASARAAGMRIIGPNAQGLANFGSGAVASFSTMFLEVEPADGPVGIISQSGMMSVMPFGLLRNRGIGVRHAHATGNDADVTLPELALAVLQDPGVRLLLLYIESIRDAETLAAAAALARERDVPIVAVKTGRTPRGQAAARSHTGALANEDRVVDAFFERHGIWRARDVHELVNAAELYLKGWRPRGRRLAVVSNSGASCVMAADSAHDVDLELATLAEPTVAALTAQLPTFATATNPIDITAALLTNSALFGSILSTLAGDVGVDLLLVALPVAGCGYDVPSFARAAEQFAAETKKPIIVATPQEQVAARFRERGVITFANQTDAVAALAQLAHHTRRLRMRATPQVRPRGRRMPIPAGESGFLNEAESLVWLRDQGLPTVPHRVCDERAGAVAAYRELGGPVVVKGCSARFPHKSEHGLVILGLDSERDVGVAFDRIRAALDAASVSDGAVLVARMIRGRREFVLGAEIDPTFGPVLMVGDGGRYVEALGDVVLLLPPVTEDEVRDALGSLRIAPLLDGVRGEPPLDVEPLCEAAVRLADIIIASAGSIASIDLNPVMVGARGEGIVIVDASIERSAGCAPPRYELHDEEQPG